MRVRLLLKDLFVYSGIKPSYLISAINGCFEFGQWIKNHPCEAVFRKREELYSYLNDTLLRAISIDYLEFGVYKGDSLRRWSSINKNPSSRFFGFDSFKGFTEDWKGVWSTSPKNTFDTHGKIPEFKDQRVRLIPGYFQSTLQNFLADYTPQKMLIVNLDADIYSATLFVLTSLARILIPGTILIFDEFNLICHEFRAFQDFTKSFCINYRTLASFNRYECVAFAIL